MHITAHKTCAQFKQSSEMCISTVLIHAVEARAGKSILFIIVNIMYTEPSL